MRSFGHLCLTKDICAGLREAIRPLTDTAYSTSVVVQFCLRLYHAYYLLESDPDRVAVDFPVDQEDVLVINQFVSAEDGEWAKDVLAQTRQVLYELITGREAVQLVSSEEIKRLIVEAPAEEATDA